MKRKIYTKEIIEKELNDNNFKLLEFINFN